MKKKVPHGGLDVYFFFNKEKKLLEITHKESEDLESVECFHMAGNNIEQMEHSVKLGLMCFNMGRLTNGDGEVAISPNIAISFLADIDNDDINDLIETIKRIE